MNKKVYKVEFADILMNFFLSRHSFPYITEWLGVKYFRRDDNQCLLKTFAADSSENVKVGKEISDLESETVFVKSTGKQFNEGIKQLSDEPPGHCSLYQNSPNPFSKKTIINFQCSSHGFISLKIYDITWKEISTILYEKIEPGTYQIEFDRTSLTDGIYFCRMDTENFSDTKKMFIER